MMMMFFLEGSVPGNEFAKPEHFMPGCFILARIKRTRKILAITFRYVATILICFSDDE